MSPRITAWRRVLLAGAACLSLGIVVPVMADDEELPQVSFDGLERMEDSKVAVAYLKPDADFSVFSRVTILDPFVAFRDNWQRDQNRRSTRRIRESDMERIKNGVSDLFREVFTERIEAAGYTVVDGAAGDVLLLRPAIIDLDITAPDIQTPGRFLDIHHPRPAPPPCTSSCSTSITGEIMGRAIDRQSSRDMGGMVQWTTRVTNTQEARRMFGGWADLLVGFMDAHYMQPSEPAG